MVTAQSVLLSIALQSDSQELLLLVLFLIVAVIFFVIFFYWWRGVSEEDLDEIKEADAKQTTGPAITGEEMSVYAQAEADAIADRENLLAEEVHYKETQVVEEETAVSEAVGEPEPESVEPDDLKKIEGIGPKIAELLNQAGIRTYSKLAETDVDQLEQILTDAGTRYRLADPTSWPEQANLAVAGDWDALNELQDKLTAGRQED
jgi:predicted flap endonuclease-1-like 5' DNA nuclease